MSPNVTENPIFLSGVVGICSFILGSYFSRKVKPSQPKACSRPKNVGILAYEVYFPSFVVKQTDLEQADGVSKGKYTEGLGQTAMAFTGDREDIHSMFLTVFSELIRKYEIPLDKIGRIEVGTETLIDKSKSAKTVLMSLFEGSGIYDVEGATVFNACYGGTAALLNAISWVQSEGWDGRYAVVIAGDIAVYGAGPARPTGGCGAVALLIGPDAPLVIDMSSRATHASHVWDFYKPNANVEYPEVNGYLSQDCYLRALDDCYTLYKQKKSKQSISFSLESSNHFFVFHSPYNKLVQKAFSRMYFHDFLSTTDRKTNEKFKNLLPWADKTLSETYQDRDLDLVLRKEVKTLFEDVVIPSCELSKQLGNTYTGAVFMNLLSLIDCKRSDLLGKSITVFSYGSGALATMYDIHVRATESDEFGLAKIYETVALQERLIKRECCSPAQLVYALDTRAKAVGKKPYTPIFPIESLFPGTYYLIEVDENYVRTYAQKSLNSKQFKNVVIIPNETTESKEFCNKERLQSESKNEEIEKEADFSQSVVVVGVSAILPGSDPCVLDSSNLDQIIKGENCITKVPKALKQAMLEKKIIQSKRTAEGVQKISLSRDEDCIQLHAKIGHVDLTQYGIAPGIADTMDRAAQVAVAAGLEALRDAKLVDVTTWKLPEHLKESTGVLYASSFPALDAAINEVTRFYEAKHDDNVELIEELALTIRSQLASGVISDESGEISRCLNRLESQISVSEVSGIEGGTLEEKNEKQQNKRVHHQYEFDRKFLFRILVLGNAQLAQIIGAQGPNIQTNAACAGTTQAIAVAQDIILQRRCDRIIVIAGDNAAGETLFPWVGTGFRILGAASIAGEVELAALPFDARRNGLLLGSGAIGVVIETEASAMKRYAELSALNTSSLSKPFKCRIIATWYSNSAFHGAALDCHHIHQELEKFLCKVETEHHISREEIARHGVYLSHETCTHASPEASCSANEIYALRQCFGDLLEEFFLINTKGFTGHAMGVSFEDVAAVEILHRGQIPAVPNYEQPDPYLGKIKVSKGGKFQAKYALRFAAGFGSQVAFGLYGV